MKLFSLVTILFVLGTHTLSAQNTNAPSIGNEFEQLLGKEKSRSTQTNIPSQIDQTIYERAVNPETYICGPGDMLALTTTMPVKVQYFIPISADGSLIIPEFGGIPLMGKTIKEAEVEIFSFLGKKYPLVKGSVALFKPRAIYVSITGEVESPGVYTLHAATPVSIALMLANTKSEQSSKGASSFATPSSKDPGYRQKIAKEFLGEEERTPKTKRNIFLRRADGSVSNVDLLKYAAMREEKCNPFLREGDEIIVPVRSNVQPTIGIYGAVKNPGEFDFVPGDDVALLVRIAFGVNAELHPTEAEMIRTTSEGVQKSMKLDVTNLEKDHTPLEPGDKIFVRAKSQRISSGRVAIKGEVKNPGVYSIKPSGITLLEAVRMAGGFSEHAFPTLTEMYRRQLSSDGNFIDLDREYSRNLRLSLLTLEDTLSYRLESRLREGMVSVDYHKLFTRNDASADVPVLDGDVIVVPRNTMSVEVVGMVVNGGFVQWKKEYELKDYIRSVGGFVDDASTGRIRVIKGNTRAWLDPDDTDIEPGDIIWVPRHPQIRSITTVELVGVIGSIMAGVAGVASLVIQVLRK